jgi:hypothetical protein
MMTSVVNTLFFNISFYEKLLLYDNLNQEHIKEMDFIQAVSRETD